MKLGQLMEYTKKNIFIQKQNEAGRLVPGPLFIFLKKLDMR